MKQADKPSFSVRIDGFRSLAEAREFLDWYEGQGEQDIDIWWEIAREKHPEFREYVTIDVHSKYRQEQNTLIAKLNEPHD